MTRCFLALMASPRCSIALRSVGADAVRSASATGWCCPGPVRVISRSMNHESLRVSVSPCFIASPQQASTRLSIARSSTTLEKKGKDDGAMSHASSSSFTVPIRSLLTD
jgi:hypothetical protein